MASGLTKRNAKSGSSGFMHNGVPVDADLEGDLYGSLMGNAEGGQQAAPCRVPQQHVNATPEGRGVDPSLDPTAQLREMGLPVRQIDLLGLQFQTLIGREVGEKQVKYGALLGWGRLLIAALYALTALALMFVVIFESNGEFPFFWDPIRFSKLDNKWEVALEKISDVHVDWALVALLATFAIYHGVHFFPIVRDIYLRLVFWYQMNPIRWIFHGVAGGLMVAFFAVVMGVSNIMVFVLLLLVVVGGAAAVLFNEMINRPNLYFVDANEKPEDLVTQFQLSIEDSTIAVRDGYFVKPGAVTPWPIGAALVLLLAYVGIVSAYFWTAVDDRAKNVPWYVWTTYFLTILSFVAMVIVNTLRLLVSWKIFQNYFYVDVIHIVVELVFIWLNAVLVIIGLSVSA